MNLIEFFVIKIFVYYIQFLIFQIMLRALWALVLLVQQSLADIDVISLISNKTITSIADYPASFGPPLPLAGFKVR